MKSVSRGPAPASALVLLACGHLPQFESGSDSLKKYVVVEVVVDLPDNLSLLLDDFSKHTIFDCKDAGHFLRATLDLGGNAHPQGHSSEDLKDDAPQAPHVDHPRIFVAVHEVEHWYIVLQLILEEDVIQDLWRHIFGCGH